MRAFVLLALAALACGGGRVGGAGPTDSGAAADGRATDASMRMDAPPRPTRDAGPPDGPAAARDTAVSDAPSPDAPAPDAPAPDGAPPDAAPAPRGATVPWIEHEAEDGVTTGVVIGPSRTWGELATEASGRRAVRLEATGHFVELVATRPASAVVVRYAVPDGTEATLSLYVGGAHRRDLALTSRYAWTYGAFPGSDDPAAGTPHHFYDEARALVGDIPAGATVRLQKDPGDAAPWYVIDLVDLEQVAPPLERPPGSLSILDFGATADDGSDDGPAIQGCIDAARGAGQAVWIPPGTFASTSRGLEVSGVAIRGAGMWHSTLEGFWARFTCAGGGCRYHDLAIRGETTRRDDASPESAFLGGGGAGSLLERVWVEHTKTGWWVGPGPTDGLVIRGCRFRNLFADAVNLCNGASNSIVEQSHARNTGDDAFASWAPAAEGGVNTGNVFRFNTVQLPWLANCFAIYGGRDNRIEDNVCADVVRYPGILVAQQFGAHPFQGTTIVQRNTLLRAGGPAYGAEHGAVKLHAFDAGFGGVVLRDLAIVDATFSGLHFQGPHALDGVTIAGVTIGGAGSHGLLVTADARGSATAEGVVVTGAARGGLSNEAGAAFTFQRGPGNAGW